MMDESKRQTDFWKYDVKENSARPDPLKSKISPELALSRLHNFDEIFPYYRTLVNDTIHDENSNVDNIEAILTLKINKVDEKLSELKDHNNQGAYMKSSKTSVIIFILISGIFPILFI